MNNNITLTVKPVATGMVLRMKNGMSPLKIAQYRVTGGAASAMHKGIRLFEKMDA